MSVTQPLESGISVVTHPTSEPVSLEMVKQHLRIDADDDDTYIDELIGGARELVETNSGLQLVKATYNYYFDHFPASSITPIEVKHSPLISVTSITYIDTDGTSQTWSNSEYELDLYSFPSRILPSYSYSYPATRHQLNAVTVQATVGYQTQSVVPRKAKQAVMLLVEHWYRNRSPVEVGVTSNEVQHTLNSLMWALKVSIF
jgi:uncharacterized phiE125 gp8 family phage protein